MVIDALADKPFVITIAGNVGAAKSTYLLAVAAEIYTAGRLGITSTVASLLPSQVDPLKQKLVSVYNDGQPLPPTPEGEIHEGYVARLQFENGERRSLALYDVPGEVIRSVQKVAQSGRFLYTSDAIILLLDPDGFPDPNAFLKPAVEGVEMAGPQMVHNLADGIEQATGQRVKVPFIVAISKSDKIVDWPAHAAPIGFPAEVQKYLEDESDIVRNMLVAQGLEPVVTAALSRFGAERTRFARVSALGMDYEHLGYGGSMKPDGCWRPIALALLLGRV
ncbi:TRAFAC clade GTPase domain-containing protein [Nocardia tenerifensis]|uniref:TRAFAC clade GTPase domain-containing protein n=1 Tax=Nocardia tenerifensis TaxID=228006 RepID=UPI0011B56441|nr:hypothetical protein [Nocardia tenerifensis]